MSQQREWRYLSENRRRLDSYLNEHDRVVRSETQVKCCGEWLSCAGFTNTCDNCHTDYNMSGQELAPREQWGEETGESVADILAIDTRTPEENLDG